MATIHNATRTPKVPRTAFFIRSFITASPSFTLPNPASRCYILHRINRPKAAMSKAPYFPHSVFSPEGEPVPRVMIAPGRYIQGPGVIDHVGRYVSILNIARVGVLASRRGQQAEGARIMDSLRGRNIDATATTFGGECSLEEIDAQVERLKEENLDCLIAAGGGKCVDAGKCIAYRLDIPVIIVPTLASNDAPCSALSVVYTKEGVSRGTEFFPDSPALVVVDTAVVADADERYLVSGMGDAMATWYEARVCLANPAARTPLGARPTLASCAMGEICAHTLYEHGLEAARSVASGSTNEVLEKVVEANTLLSGIGFESGGLAVAHAIALAYTRIPVVHDNYLHGEMVAMGTMVQLAMEGGDEATRAARFFASVGLPIHLAQLSLSRDNHGAINTLIEATLASNITHNMPMMVTDDVLRNAINVADELGRQVTEDVGDLSYRRLQGL